MIISCKRFVDKWKKKKKKKKKIHYSTNPGLKDSSHTSARTYTRTHARTHARLLQLDMNCMLWIRSWSELFKEKPRTLAEEPQRQKTYLLTCSLNETSNQSVRCSHEVSYILGYPKYAQWRFWSGYENTQADLNFRWAHVSEGTFSDIAVHSNPWQVVLKSVKQF